jgi:hypothetical protein
MDQGGREVPNYGLQVSFSTPQAIHEMGFVQFEENQVLSFLAPSQSSQISQPLNTNTTTNSHMGFSHNDEQVCILYYSVMENLVQKRLGLLDL